jgi:hypothetical protein
MSESTVKHRAKSPKAGKPNTDAEPKDDGSKNGDNKKSSSSSAKTYAMLIVGAIVLYVAYKYLGSQVDVKGGLEKAVDFVEKQGNTAVFW